MQIFCAKMIGSEKLTLFCTMMTRLLPLSLTLTLALFVTTIPLFAKDAIPLMICGVSIGEEKAVVVKFLGAWDVAARRSPVRHLLQTRFPRRVCHRQQRRPEEGGLRQDRRALLGHPRTWRRVGIIARNLLFKPSFLERLPPRSSSREMFATGISIANKVKVFCPDPPTREF